MLVFLDGKKTKVIQFLKLSQIMYSLKSCFTFLELELCLSISTNACIIFSHNLKKVIIQLVVDTFPDSTFVVIRDLVLCLKSRLNIFQNMNNLSMSLN